MSTTAPGTTNRGGSEPLGRAVPTALRLPRWLDRRSPRRLHRLRAAGPAGRGWALVLGSAMRRPRLAGVLVGLLAASISAPLGGPVAAALAAIYTNLGLVALRRHRRARTAGAAESAALDAIGGLAADLRAGMSPTAAFGHALPVLESSTVDGVRRIAHRVDTAGRVADLAGVPLADLLDRLEVDARGLRQVATMAAAQAAGTRATAWLLAALPAAGIGLGYGMGADPVHVLLHTPMGAACAALAAAFQLAGLAWSTRLARSVAEVH